MTAMSVGNIRFLIPTLSKAFESSLGHGVNLILGMIIDPRKDTWAGRRGGGRPSGYMRRFQRTSSVHSTPIERSWRDLNDVTRKYRDLFKDLESRDLFRGGRNADPLDVFCLTTVFVPLIQRDVDEHFLAMAYRKKNKDTSNPNVPRARGAR